MKTDTMLKICMLCVICAALMSGCLEATRTTEFGTSTYNFVTDETVYVVDHYKDGCHVTGTMSRTIDGDWCYNLHAKVDEYEGGAHITGYRTLNGCGDDVEWYSRLTATKDGYKTQYKNGYDDAEWRCD